MGFGLVLLGFTGTAVSVPEASTDHSRREKCVFQILYCQNCTSHAVGPVVYWRGVTKPPERERSRGNCMNKRVLYSCYVTSPFQRPTSGINRFYNTSFASLEWKAKSEFYKAQN